jgi:hypothetical protein
MNRISRFLLVTAVCGVSSAGIVTAAEAARHDHKVVICHGTASEKNPYVLISVDTHALEGHFDGSAPGHGKNNHPDLLFVDGECVAPDEVGGGTQGGGTE